MVMVADAFFSKEPFPIVQRDDFACGAEVGNYCGHVPRDEVRECLRQHRRELGRDCRDRIIEDESFHCGIVAEHLCGAARKNGTQAFRECLRQHVKELEQVCPEEKSADKWDERANIHCGFEFDEYCSKCGRDRACVEKCVGELAHKSEDCDRALHERLDFECGLDVDVECGAARKLGPFDFVHCIQEKRPCKFRI